MNLLGKAISIAADAFEEVTDKAGQAYILHCLFVMEKVKHLGEDAMIVGILHDLLEDTFWTPEMIVAEGFPIHIVTLLDNVTHRKDEPYMEYIKRCSHHPISKAVKMADLTHNSQIFRMKGLRKKDFDRLEKYFTAYQYLSE